MLVSKNISNIFLFAVLWLTPIVAYSATDDPMIPDFSSQNQLLKYSEDLRKDYSKSPTEILALTQLLAQKSQEQNWTVGYLFASTLSIETEIKQEDIKSAKARYDEVHERIWELNNPVLTTRLRMADLKIRFAFGDITDIDDSYPALISRAQESADPSEIGEIYLAIGLSQLGTSKLPESIKSLNKAYEAFSQIDAPVSTALVLNSLADAYHVLGDRKLAIEYFKLALDLHETFDDKFGESVVLYNLGRVYLRTEELDLAQDAFEKAVNISIEIDDTIGIAWAQSALSRLALDRENWVKALNLAKSAEPVFAEVGDLQSQFDAILFQARAYFGTNDIVNAEQNLNRAFELLPPAQNVSAFFQYHKTKSDIAAKKGDFETAYESFKKKYDWMMENHKQNREKEVIRYKVEFDSQLKEQQNEILQKDVELQQLRILEKQREEKIWLLGIVLSILLLIFVLSLLFIQIKNRNRFERLALQDHLTNSPNRRAILEYAEAKFNEAKFAETSFVIGLVDLDSFKKLNDTYGHDTGDEVLKNFATACSSFLRGKDKYGRYGGEEWLLVFSDTDISQLHKIFERITEHLNQLPAKGLPKDQKVTFSMGAVAYQKGKYKNISAMINEADQKLYTAKENGRNRLER